MEVALKIADSRKILVVLFETPECKPPKTPAIHRFSPPLVIISSLPVSFRFSPSNVSNSVPFIAFLIEISFCIALRSKACIGVPNSNMTKLVTSTTLLIGSNPIDFKWFFSHFGDGSTTTLSRTAPIYLGQSSGFSILILIPLFCEVVPVLMTDSGSFISRLAFS